MYSVVTSRVSKYGVRQYFCDFAIDVNNLPRTGLPGSTAFVLETGETYILNHTKDWVLIETTNGENSGSSGNGSGSNTDNPGSGSGSSCNCGCQNNNHDHCCHDHHHHDHCHDHHHHHHCDDTIYDGGDLDKDDTQDLWVIWDGGDV